MPVHLPLITALYAGLNGLLALALAIRVTMTRAKRKILIGDGGDAVMLQVIRTHANNAEYVPLALVLLAIIEMLGAPGLAVHVLGILLIVSRLFHAQGLFTSSGLSLGRVVGGTGTWVVVLLACLYALYLFAIGGRA